MLRYPWWLSFGMFSENGPTSEQIDASTFVSEFFGEGYSHNVLRQYNNDPLQIPKHTKCDLTVYCKIHGPDSGYHGTALICIESAICLLEEEHMIRAGNINQRQPPITGGVFTPSTVFSATSLIQRLHKSGIFVELMPYNKKDKPIRSLL
ncbi:hypothetical protein RFI_04675 [Reticulomyxa filosa]|uniref:Uncharacterized protein n=1 Tax=Reticulomyxa filosa TaxID=46433 RepID=X6P4C2_RETFI|nr:hypothetical protein RFI_04675 [Reticulomyxa filosa]|eukprot:ETO32442.1 hypothetical protein RFI_04675 [Reticulomyxa filosa]